MSRTRTAATPSRNRPGEPAATGPPRPPRHGLDRARLRRWGLLVPDSPDPLLMEEIRQLRTSLWTDLGRARDPMARAVVVTSARPGEGKTFLAVNLALALALDPEVRVVLVDADGVRRAASDALGLAEAPGLAELLTGGPEQLPHVFHRTDLGQLLVLPAGRPDPTLTDRLASRRMARILHALIADPATLVLLDTPPVLAGSEALALAPHVGRVLFVVEAGRTPRAEIEQALRPLVRVSEVRLVLNKVAPGAARRYDYAPPRRRRWRLAAWCLAAGLAFAPTFGLEARTRAELRATTTVAAGDNLEESPAGDERAGVLVHTGVGARLQHRGRRLRLWLEGAVGESIAWADRRLAEMRGELEGALRLDLWQRRLGLDAAVAVGEESLGESSPLTAPDVGLARGRTRRVTVAAGPELRLRLARLAAMELAWRYARTAYGDGRTADVSTRETRLRLADRAGGRADWSLVAVHSRSSLDPTRTAPARRREILAVDAEGAIELVDGWVVILGAGWADRRDDTRRDRFTRGPAFRAGVRARLNRRVQLELLYGVRAGDRDGRGELAFALGPRSQLALRYRERVLSRATLARENLPTLEDTGAAPAAAPDSPVPLLPTVVGTDASFTSRRGELLLERAGVRDRVRALLFLERRAFRDPLFADQWRLGGEVRWQHRLKRRSELELALALERLRFDGGGRRDEWRARLAWLQQLSRRTRLALGYEFGRRQGRGEDVTANLLFLTLERRF